MSSAIDWDKDPNWLGHRARDALRPNADKIVTNSDFKIGGWEKWLQFELSYNLTKVSQNATFAPPPQASQIEADQEFTNEVEPPIFRASVDVEQKYQGSNKRSDFTLQVSNGVDHFENHDVEMKCRSSKESYSAFVGRVGEDLDKVKESEWLEGLSPETTHASQWVMAVTVGNEELDGRMRALAQQKRIEWKELPVTPDGKVKVWTYLHSYRGSCHNSLLSYSTETRIQRDMRITGRY
jgi:hypothetical protein